MPRILARVPLTAVALVTVAATVISGCSSSGGAKSPSTSGATSSTGAARGSGPVSVLYAGSLVNLMEKQVGPGFQSATGYTVNGYSGGSSALATQITGKVHQGDVFISASPKVTDTLMGTANGNWVSWYGTFATSALVIGYNPKSSFAADLKSKPWYDVITEKGFRLGTTDPATDPKGKLAAEALTDTATSKNLPALKALAKDTSDVFPEETLVGRLQAGQLDAGFFYVSEATAAGISTVPLTGEDLKASYTISILKGAPNEAGAEAFVQYLLGASGQAILTQDGFTLVSPAKLTGSGVPTSLQSLFAS